MTHLSLSRAHFPVTTLGPGRRVGVWFQGCTIHCPGCISADTWPAGRAATELDDLMATLAPWARYADGLTVSGGEPFEQPAALAALLRAWRAMSNTPVLVFTGLAFKALAPWLEDHPGLIDALVAGPYVRDAGQTLALRGSDNQTLHVLTPRGNPLAAYDRPATAADRRLDVMFDLDGGAWFAGIPAAGDFQRLRDALRANGHLVITSEAARP